MVVVLAILWVILSVIYEKWSINKRCREYEEEKKKRGF